jgi:hypothetical protein
VVGGLLRAGSTGTVTRTAWLARVPESEAIWIAVFEDAGFAERLLRPRSLGANMGIWCTPALKRLWPELPEALARDEQLSTVGAGKLEDALDLLTARFQSAQGGPSGWTLNFVQAPSPAEAEAIFDRAFVAPRRATIQGVLEGKNRPSYDLGVKMVEIGDRSGWLLTGAAGGKLQELYFVKEAKVFLIQAPLASPGDPPQEQVLLEHALSLPVWDKKGG